WARSRPVSLFSCPCTRSSKTTTCSHGRKTCGKRKAKKPCNGCNRLRANRMPAARATSTLSTARCPTYQKSLRPAIRVSGHQRRYRPRSPKEGKEPLFQPGVKTPPKQSHGKPRKRRGIDELSSSLTRQQPVS